jgi:hypothetical protein
VINFKKSQPFGWFTKGPKAPYKVNHQINKNIYKNNKD